MALEKSEVKIGGFGLGPSKGPGLHSMLRQAITTLSRHPAYLFSRLSFYARYERARMRALKRRGLSAVFCMGTFYLVPDSEDSNTGVTSSILLRGGTYEPESTFVFARLLAPGDTVLDVGANIGWYTLLAASIVGSRGRVVAFEPEPGNFGLLEESVKLNRLENVTTVDKCVSDRRGETFLNLSASNAGGHSMIFAAEGDRKLRVNTTTLDDTVAALRLDQVDVIKIDAESAEPLIILGAKTLLSRTELRAILMEYSPDAWIGHANILNGLFNDFDVFEIHRHSLTSVVRARLPTRRQAMLVLKRKAEPSRDGMAPLA